MKQKKLMLLGGSRYLLPAIEAAHRLRGADATAKRLCAVRTILCTPSYALGSVPLALCEIQNVIATYDRSLLGFAYGC